MHEAHVDAVEAALSAGMPESPSRSPAEAQVRDLLIRATKESILLLTDSVTAENAMRVLTQIGKTALAHRKTLTLYGNFPLDEELEGNRGRQTLLQSSGGGPLSALMGGDRETAAVHMLRELVSSYQQKQRVEQVGSLLTAAKEFRACGDVVRAEIFEKKARRMADAAVHNRETTTPPEVMVSALTARTGDPDGQEHSSIETVPPEVPVSALTALTGDPDEQEHASIETVPPEVLVSALTALMGDPDEQEHSSIETVPLADASGANIWGATLGDAMNGDSGTAPHPGEDLTEGDDADNETDDFTAPGYNA